MFSYGYWHRHFGGDRSSSGARSTSMPQSRVIVGVMPRGFQIVDHDFDILVPLAFDRTHQIACAALLTRGIARLQPGSLAFRRPTRDIARLMPVWMDSWSNAPGTNPHWYRHLEDHAGSALFEGAGDRQHSSRCFGW